jgi:AAA15 family ATPase/GTPase
VLYNGNKLGDILGQEFMYTSLHIQNFRGFRDLKIKQLGRVNLIGGHNNVGKTALLEAIFLLSAPNNPNQRFSLIQRRGSVLSSKSFLISELWAPLFIDFDTDQQISLAADSRDGQLSLIINVSDEKVEYNHHRRGETYRSEAQIINNEIKPIQANVPGLPMVIFPSARLFTSLERLEYLAEGFSKADDAGQVDDIVQALRVIEPRLHSIRLRFEGGNPILYGDVGTAKPLPLALMGDGLSQLLEMLLNIVASFPDGVVLFDEIENGMHFSVMKKVWQALNQFSAEHNVQIFAATHSDECIRAAKEAFEADGMLSDFRYHRLDRLENGDIEAVTYSDEAIRGAVEFNTEMR